jgi:hypothetical protein
VAQLSDPIAKLACRDREQVRQITKLRPGSTSPASSAMNVGIPPLALNGSDARDRHLTERTVQRLR